MLIAIGHIVGSILTVTAISVLIALFASWEAKRNHRLFLEETATRLGVAVADLDGEEGIRKLIQFSSKRFSSDLLSNRVSDLCGIVRTAWGWLGFLVQAVILVSVVWNVFTGSPDIAVYAWFVAGVALVFWVVSVIFSLLCRLFTGRYPGEARQSRRSMAAFLNHEATS